MCTVGYQAVEGSLSLSLQHWPTQASGDTPTFSTHLQCNLPLHGHVVSISGPFVMGRRNGRVACDLGHPDTHFDATVMPE